MQSKNGCGHVFIASWIPTVKACYCPECKMEILIELQYGTTSKPCQERSGELSILFSAASHNDDRARTLALQEMEKAWQESEADYFSRSCAWPKKSSPHIYFLKTFLPSQAEADFKSLEKLPKWGMTVDGALYPLQALERYTNAKGSSCWPTPQARAQTDTPSERKRHTPCLETEVKLQEVAGSGKLNPHWVEWLMGYQIGWTSLKPSVMQWYLNRRKKRSKS